MPREYDRSSRVPTVKLFPRLATANAMATRVRMDQSVTVKLDKIADRAGQAELERTQVRTRLLRMILNNECVRRNDQRPNAG